MWHSSRFPPAVPPAMSWWCWAERLAKQSTTSLSCVVNNKTDDAKKSSSFIWSCLPVSWSLIKNRRNAFCMMSFNSQRYAIYQQYAMLWIAIPCKPRLFCSVYKKNMDILFTTWRRSIASRMKWPRHGWFKLISWSISLLPEMLWTFVSLQTEHRCFLDCWLYKYLKMSWKCSFFVIFCHFLYQLKRSFYFIKPQTYQSIMRIIIPCSQ